MATRTAKKVALVKGRRLRVTRSDGCGRPAFGDDATITSKGFISVAFTALSTASDEIRVTNAAGETIVYEGSVTTLSGYGIEIVLGEVDPEMLSVLTGQPVVYDLDGNPIGFDVDTQIVLTDSGFALELWAGAPSGDACDDDEADGQYGYLLLPFLQGGILGDFTVENGGISFTVTGANTKDGNDWGVGPYNVMLNPGDPAIAAPVLTLGAKLTGSGTFAAGTYYWKITAINAHGQTIASNEVTNTLLLNDRQTLNWAAVTGATGYKVYRGTTVNGEDHLISTLGAVVTYIDTGAAGTAATPPVANTTAGPKVPGPMTTPIGATIALRVLIVDVAPPAALTGSRPLLNPDWAQTVTVTPTTHTGTLSVDFAIAPDPAPGVGVWYDFGDDTWEYVSEADDAQGDVTHLYAAAGTYTVSASTNGVWVTASVTVPGV